MQQAQRVSDKTAFMYLGKLIEYQNTNKLFGEPQEQLTRNYLAGNFG
jgi:phosphate transport system ATP-binding protein